MDELTGSGMNSLMAELGNPNKANYKTDVKAKRVQDTRTRLMINLKDFTVTLPEYMLSFGSIIDCKEKCDNMLEDLEEQEARDAKLEAAKQPIETTPGKHSKVSKKKYQNVGGELSAKTNAEKVPQEDLESTPLRKKSTKRRKKV